MDTTSLEIIYFISSVILIVSTICFFVLCYNVSKLKKRFTDDFSEYHIHNNMGDKQKAYYHLLRAYVTNSESNMTIEKYYKLFKKLGSGIPNFEEFEKLKKEEEKK